MELIVRSAEERDIDAVTRLNMEATRLMRALSPQGFGEALAARLDPHEEKLFFEEASSDDNTVLLVAELGGEVRGFVMGVVETHPDDLLSAPFVTVQFIAVDERFRGSGTGRALMNAVEDWARSRGATSLDLAVWASNQPAQELFEKSGYIPLEIRMAKRLD